MQDHVVDSAIILPGSVITGIGLYSGYIHDVAGPIATLAAAILLPAVLFWRIKVAIRQARLLDLEIEEKEKSNNTG
ncbi:hypothetical protein KAR91_54650 [Candidatus Pacearchaeota archaeon]|nr:hypothetical protein [Candidatus Pacearchaeota archaeon]